MRRNFIWAGVLALVVMMSSYSQADIVIDFTTDTNDPLAPGATGDLLDDIASVFSSDLPATVDVVEDAIFGLTLTVDSGSSFDPANTDVNAASSSFGPNSPTPTGGSENPTRFDVDAAELIQISFNLDVFVESIDLTSLSGDDEFTVGTVTGIDDNNTNGSDIFDFTSGGTSQGIFLAAGSTLLLEATGPAGTSVGIQALDVTVAVPEPGSLLGLMGLAGLFAVKRRRN